VFHPKDNTILYASSSDEVVQLKTNRTPAQEGITEFNLDALDPNPKPAQPKGKNSKVKKKSVTRESTEASQVSVVPFGPDVTCQSRGLAINSLGTKIFLGTNFLGKVIAFDTKTHKLIWTHNARMRDPIPQENAHEAPEAREKIQTAVLVNNNKTEQLWISGHNIEGQRLLLVTGILANPFLVASQPNAVLNIGYIDYKLFQGGLYFCANHFL
jgi:hypothetical protein